MMTPSTACLLFSLSLTILVGQLNARGLVTSDLTCGDDADCQIRSRSQNSYCSFASGEFRDGKPFGWCKNGKIGTEPFKNGGLLKPVVEPQQSFKIPLRPVQRPTPISSYNQNKNYGDGGWRKNGNGQGSWNGVSGSNNNNNHVIRPEVIPAWRHTTHAPYKPSTKEESTWDYTCGNDADCQLRGHAKCSFASGEFRNGKPRGWCQPKQTSTPKYGHQHGNQGQWSGVIDNY